MLAIDSTYQTNKDECPLVLFGKTGSYGKFHAIGIALTKKEDQESYKFVFDFFSRACVIHPECVMADGDTSITEVVHSTSARLMCFTHVLRNCNEKLAGIRASDPDISKRIANIIRWMMNLSMYCTD